MSSPEKVYDILSPFFDLLGSEKRLHAIFIVHASHLINVHDHPMPNEGGLSCIRTSTIAQNLGLSTTSTLYHLNKLQEGELVKRESMIDDNGRPILLWSTTEKWRILARDYNIESKIIDYLREKNPDLFK